MKKNYIFTYIGFLVFIFFLSVKAVYAACDPPECGGALPACGVGFSCVADCCIVDVAPTSTPVPPTATPVPGGGSCDAGCGTCGYRNSSGVCSTDNSCCHRTCSGGSCITVSGGGTNECDTNAQCSVPPTSTPTPAASSPIGWHDSTSVTSGINCQVGGWTCDPDNFSEQLYIHMYADGDSSTGTYVGDYLANDVSEQGVYDVCGGISVDHRFSFDLPDVLKDGISHDLYVYGIGVDPSGNLLGPNKLLDGNPKTYTCSLPPSCTLNLTPTTLDIDAGSSDVVTALVTDIVGGSVDAVTFSSNDNGIATVNPTSDSTIPYVSTVDAVFPGSAIVTAEATVTSAFGDTYTCSDTSVITVTNPNSCQITVPDVTVAAGESSQILVSLDSEIGSTISEISFIVADDTIAAVTSPDTSAAFTSDITGILLGNTTYTAEALMEDGITFCSAVGDIEVVSPDPWWQVLNGSVTTNGSVLSSIPASCTEPTCFPYFISGDVSGLLTHAGTLGFGSGAVSNSNRQADSYYSGRAYSYDYFINRLDDGEVLVNIGSTVQINDLVSGGTLIDGYYYYFYDGSGGPLTIDGPASINLANRKVVLFADSDVVINETLQVNDGVGFFALISSGDVTLNPSDLSTDTNTVPHLEGIYILNGVFTTGTLGTSSDGQFYIRGSVVADDFSFERNLPDNSVTPAEVFEFAPDQVLLFPRKLSKKNLEWREVAP